MNISFSGGCPDGYVEFESSCYKVYTGKKYAYAASEACVEDGAHLAYITSQAEQDFIAGQLVASTWIGLRKLADENAVSWWDGTPLDFTKWKSDEPNSLDSGDNECVRMRESSDYKWADMDCNTNYDYVCEVEGKMPSSTQFACHGKRTQVTQLPCVSSSYIICILSSWKRHKGALSLGSFCRGRADVIL